MIIANPFRAPENVRSILVTQLGDSGDVIWTIHSII